MNTKASPEVSYVRCVENSGYPAALELQKIYQRVPDARAEADDFLRVVDESGESYLYPARFFVPAASQGVGNMRELFRAFYPLSDVDRERAWAEGLIIVDTSALLNLYRYPLAARDRLLTVLGRLKDRLWLPHQAALEYQRNQPAVRLDQTTRFRKVRDEVGGLKADFTNRIDKLQLKKRHALIDPEPLLSSVLASIDAFQHNLNTIEREEAILYQEGSLQSKIEELFEGRIGEAPTQDFLDALYKEGRERYENKIPPGYQDWQKGDSSREPTTFSFGGLIFQPRFGDLIFWKQILQKTHTDTIQWFVLVTDDTKEDWWQVVSGQRIGPRTELLDEAIREGGVEGFVLETSERFAEQAARMLGIEISDEVIQQISTTKRSEASSADIGEQPGFLEKLSDTEDGLEELTRASQGLTLETRRIGGIVQDSTKKLRASKDTRMKTRILNEAAAEISTTAESFEERVDAFDVNLKKIEAGVEFIIERLNQAEASGTEAPEIRENLKSLFLAIIATAESAESYDATLADLPDATAALRSSIRRLRDGVQHYIRAASRVQRWLDSLA